MAWYDEWAALIPLLETMQMAECQRCRSFQADFEAQEHEHKSDEDGWREMIESQGKTILAFTNHVSSLERQLATAQRQAQQQQQQLDAMREQLQAANRAQCNADYMKGY